MFLFSLISVLHFSPIVVPTRVMVEVLIMIVSLSRTLPRKLHPLVKALSWVLTSFVVLPLELTTGSLHLRLFAVWAYPSWSDLSLTDLRFLQSMQEDLMASRSFMNNSSVRKDPARSQWKKLLLMWTSNIDRTLLIECFQSNAFNRMLSIDCFQSNAFNQALSIKPFQSNALNWTLWIKRFQSNAFDRTLSIERFRSNAFDRTLSIERFQSNAYKIYWMSAQLANSSTVHVHWSDLNAFKLNNFLNGLFCKTVLLSNWTYLYNKH